MFHRFRCVRISHWCLDQDTHCKKWETKVRNYRIRPFVSHFLECTRVVLHNCLILSICVIKYDAIKLEYFLLALDDHIFQKGLRFDCIIQMILIKILFILQKLFRNFKYYFIKHFFLIKSNMNIFSLYRSMKLLNYI